MQLQQAPVPPGDEVIERFPTIPSNGWIAWGAAILGLGVLVLLTVVGAQAGLALAGVAGGLVVAAICWPVAVIAYRWGRLAPVLTSSRLLLPGAFSGWRWIDLAHVTGVGLRFRFLQKGPSTWDICIWLDDGTQVGMGVAEQATGSLGGLDGDTVTHTVWRRLSDTAQGRAARLLNDQVLAVQGADGLLARERRETLVDPDRKDDIAYWSPDGSMGTLR